MVGKRKGHLSAEDGFARHTARGSDSEAAESEGATAASPAEEIQNEAPASQTEALTPAQEKALASLQKCLVAIQTKLRAALADAKQDRDPRVAEYLRKSIERLIDKHYDEILNSNSLSLPTVTEARPPVVGMKLRFSGVSETWKEVQAVVEADAQSQGYEGRKLKQVVKNNILFYRNLLGDAIVNTFSNPNTPDLRQSTIMMRESRQQNKGPASENTENVEKATEAAAGINEKRQGAAKETWGKFWTRWLLQASIVSILYVVTGGLPIYSVIVSLGLMPFIGPWLRKGVEAIAGSSKFNFFTILILSVLTSIALGNVTNEVMTNLFPETNADVQSWWSARNAEAQGLYSEAQQKIAAAAAEANTPPDMNILSDPDFDPGDKVTLRGTNLTFLIGPNGETSLTDYDPNAPTKSADEFNNFKDAVHYRDSTAPPAPTITQERIPMDMPPRADAPVAPVAPEAPETATGSAEAPAQPAPTADAPAQPTATGSETVAPPAEIGPVFAGGNEGMVSILERLREQVQQAAAMGVTFPEGSLADQLLKADSQADLIKIAQDNGWFNTVADTAGTPDSIVIHENDQFAINNDGELVAPKDFESRGMTDTGDYTPEGTVKR